MTLICTGHLHGDWTIINNLHICLLFNVPFTVLNTLFALSRVLCYIASLSQFIDEQPEVKTLALNDDPKYIIVQMALVEHSLRIIHLTIHGVSFKTPCNLMWLGFLLHFLIFILIYACIHPLNHSSNSTNSC
jgi:hypothetical protein